MYQLLFQTNLSPMTKEPKQWLEYVKEHLDHNFFNMLNQLTDHLLKIQYIMYTKILIRKFKYILGFLLFKI